MLFQYILNQPCRVPVHLDHRQSYSYFMAGITTFDQVDCEIEDKSKYRHGPTTFEGQPAVHERMKRI